MPPRHGKSELFSKYLPACFLGNHPDLSVILATYEAKFARTWGRKAKAVFHKSAPECYDLQLGQKRSDDHWTVAEHEGSMQTAGVGGPMTGKGADLLLIDDPIKNAAEALSQTLRDNQWDWWLSTAMTRIEPGGRVAVLMTRWHEDDLTGRIMKLAKETGETWLHVVIPAICEDDTCEVEQFLGRKNGEPLWPERYGLGQLKVHEASSPIWWNGMYQQRPAPLEGNLVKKAWLRYFEVLEIDGLKYVALHKPEGTVRVRWTDCTLFFTIDLAASEKTQADETVISAWLLVRETGELCWLDATGGHIEGPDQEGLIIQQANAYQPTLIGVESTAYQLTMFQNLIRKGLPGYKLKADKDKLSRFIPASALYKAGQIYHRLYAPWLTTAEDQLLKFPNHAHDDYVDTVSYAAKLISYLSGAGEMPLEGY